MAKGWSGESGEVDARTAVGAGSPGRCSSLDAPQRQVVDGSGRFPYFRRVTPTPQHVLPLVEPVAAPVLRALRLGAGYADDLQPDTDGRDRWFWSHCARFRARQVLAAADKAGWVLVDDVPNSGIHLRVRDLHRVRVLRSLEGTTPHPGRNKARLDYYHQEALLLANDNSLPPLSLIMDWRMVEDEPSIHIGLPKGRWDYGSAAKLYWRVPVTGDPNEDLKNARFDPGVSPGDVTVTLLVDESEEGAG